MAERIVRDIIDLKKPANASALQMKHRLEQLGLGEEGFKDRVFVYTHPEGRVFRDAIIERIYDDYSVDVQFGSSGHALFANPDRLEIQQD